MTITYESNGEGVCQITLNRPDKLNAFNRQLRLDLLNALRDAADDDAIRAVVITGAGRGFSAGADISAIDEIDDIEAQLNTEYGPFLQLIQTMPKPVIAAINGPAAGIGMSLALTCDLRVMGQSAYLMSAFSNIGLVPDGGLSWLLTQQIGYARAFQLAVEAEKIDAGRALDWGLVNRVVEDETVVGEARKWAQSIAARAPLAIGATKRAFRAAAQEGLKNAMAFEAMLQRDLIKSEDCAEGVGALMAKRKPEFKGR